MPALEIEDLTVDASGRGLGRLSLSIEAGHVVALGVLPAAADCANAMAGADNDPDATAAALRRITAPYRRALARTLVGLAPAPEGRIRVEGQDVTERLPDPRLVGHVVAGAELLPHLSVRDNIRYGLDPTLEVERLLDDELDALAAQLQLERVLDKLPGQTSPEERFRTALARTGLRAPGALVIEVPPEEATFLRDLSLLDDGRLRDDLAPAVILCTAEPGLVSLVNPEARVSVPLVTGGDEG